MPAGLGAGADGAEKLAWEVDKARTRTMCRGEGMGCCFCDGFVAGEKIA